MANDPNGKQGSSNTKTSESGKRGVNSSTDFSKRSDPLPKPPTTTVSNHTPNLKGQKKD